MTLVFITFLSYALSDKVMVWLLLDVLFVGTYVYNSQNGILTELCGSLWHKALSLTKGALEKVPKYKAD